MDSPGRYRLLAAGVTALIAAAALQLTHSSLSPTREFPTDPGVLHKVGVVLAPRGGTWDNLLVESPSVVRDGDRWAMAFTGYGNVGGVERGAVGLAFSGDGVHWRQRAEPTLTGTGEPGSSDAAGVTAPVLVRSDHGWVMFYVGLTAPGYEQGTKTINVATAEHLAGPWTRRGAVVTPDGDGWRAKAVWHVSVVHAKGRWWMFFNATGADDRETIGLASARTLLGPWSVDDARSPLLSPTGGSWDSTFVGDPDVRRDGGRWVMDYYGYDGRHAGDGEAVTSLADFPFGWVKTGVVLAPSEPYDARYAHKPWVVKVAGRLFHYYTAESSTGRRTIALATS